MVDSEENNKKTLHLGADLETNFVFKFREYCRENDFKQKTLIRRLVEWWLALDPIGQEHLYRSRLQAEPVKSTKVKCSDVDISECIEIVKHFVTIKLPSPEEQRMISALRKALGPEPKQKRKRG